MLAYPLISPSVRNIILWIERRKIMEVKLKYKSVLDVYKYVFMDYSHNFEQRKIPKAFPLFAIILINISFLYEYFIRGAMKQELLLIFGIELLLMILFLGLPFRFGYNYYKHRNNLTYFIDLENFTISCKNDYTEIDSEEFTIDFKKSYLITNKSIYLYCFLDGKHTIFFIERSMCDTCDFNELSSYL